MNDFHNDPELDLPSESAMLKAVYRESGLTVADLASGTGLSVGTVHIALNGIRYRDGKAKVAIPPDATLVKLASALRIHPDVLRAQGRARAAELLIEASRAEAGQREVYATSEREAQAAVAGRSVLARQVLAAFSDEELHAELKRRPRSEHILMKRQDEDDLAETLTTERWPL